LQKYTEASIFLFEQVSASYGYVFWKFQSCDGDYRSTCAEVRRKHEYVSEQQFVIEHHPRDREEQK
jgi:hypothetical protein